MVVNLDHYQTNNYMFNSKPFYLHLGGYKMIMTVYSNGVGERKNMHVSVYMLVFFAVNLMLNFDGHSVALTVEAYNRTLEQWSNRTEIVLNSQECDL